MTLFTIKMSALAGVAAFAALAAGSAVSGEARAQDFAPTFEGGQSSMFEMPGGSWSRSCMAGMVIMGELRATCRDSRGFYQQSVIRIDGCRGAEIVNDNGRLTCYPVVDRPRDGWGRRGGARGGRSGWITVYEHTNFNGRSQTFDRAVPSMVPLRWNDIISSMEMRGVWEICEHVDFRGRCEVFDADESNLVSLGWNDIVSSIRPLR